jgi:hypothetical protein
MTAATWNAIPASDAALRHAAKWGTMVLESLRNGQEVPRPGLPKGADPDDTLRGLAGYWGVDPSITAPNEIIAAAVRAIGQVSIDTLDDRAMQLEVIARQAGAIKIKPPGLEALTPEQSAELSYAISNNRTPDELLSSDLPDSVRLAVARAVPAAIWEADILHDQRYGVPGNTGGAGTEGDPE